MATTKYEDFMRIGATWDAFVAEVNASNDIGTSVTFTDSGLLQITQVSSKVPLSTPMTITFTLPQALWVAEQITRLMITPNA